MANLDFILQGLSNTDDHFASTHNVFSLPEVTNGIVASAFMNAAGASIIAEMVAPLADRIKVFVGVRNDVTTLQAIQTLVCQNIYPILVDTATQAFIFHPKVYMTRNAEHARLIVGSANATTGGMVKNIEASLYAELDMCVADDVSATIRDILVKDMQLSIDLLPFPRTILKEDGDNYIFRILNTENIRIENIKTDIPEELQKLFKGNFYTLNSSVGGISSITGG